MRTVLASALALTAVLFATSIVSAQQTDRSTSAAAAALNLNSATLEQLEALPGVGPKTAQLILEYRQKSGGFKKIEELMNIKGIGEKAFLKLKPMVVVSSKPEKAGGER